MSQNRVALFVVFASILIVGAAVSMQSAAALKPESHSSALAEWQTELVDGGDSDVGVYSSIAVDGGGHLYISYYDAQNSDLKFAYHDGDEWHSEVVDSETPVYEAGEGTSLAIDSAGHPHISYYDSFNYALRYARFDGMDWISETVLLNSGEHSSLALDSEGHPHISHYRPTDQDLIYSHFDGKSWEHRIVDPGGDVGRYSSIALTASGLPRISYYDAVAGDLRYAYLESNTWYTQTVDSAGDAGQGSSLDLDVKGMPHISYQEAGNQELRHAYLDGSIWQIEPVDISVGVNTSLVLDGDNLPHISYMFAGKGGSALMYAHFDGMDWNLEAVESSTGSIGAYSSLALDADEAPHISYYDADNGDLTYATMPVPDTTPPRITSGPAVSSITENGAVIAWQTDEASSSLVHYGPKAGLYSHQQGDPALVTSHQITLSGLASASLYHYMVESTDAASNTVASKEGFLETLPPGDSEPPQVTGFTVTRAGKEYYEMAAEVTDNDEVERVEFYLDEKLIGIDYTSSSPYQIPLALSRLDMSRQEFFSPHTVTAVAIDRTRLEGIEENPFTPLFESVGSDLHFTRPESDYTIYIPGSTVPPGTLVPIEVFAAVYRRSCHWVPTHLGGRGEIGCIREADPMPTVEYYVDGSLVHTKTSGAGDELVQSYDEWDAGGLALYSQHTVNVTGIAGDGSESVVSRTFAITRGQPYIEVSREVHRNGNYFSITLTVENNGTGNLTNLRVRDNTHGFQPVAHPTEDYDVRVDVTPTVHLATPDFELRSGRVISPGHSMTFRYVAVPFLHPDIEDWDYGIGRDPVRVAYSGGAGGVQQDVFELPCEVTRDRESPSQAAGLAVREADYLIVTRPSGLYLLYDEGNVDALLMAMAELAQLKTGVLGYVTSADRARVRDTVHAWGSRMRSSDGVYEDYLSHGYLLLVGGPEIVESHRRAYKWPHSVLYVLKENVNYTDLPFANTNGSELAPELMVGRVIGNNAEELKRPIQDSINVYKGQVGQGIPGYEFDRSHALVLAGRGDGVGEFEANAENIVDLLDDEFHVELSKQRDVESAGRVMTEEVKLLDANQDVVFYRDHCDENWWSRALVWKDFVRAPTVDFEDSKPFAFACCCEAGRYAGFGHGMAESFLQNGAPAYIGATEVSDRGANAVACQKFFEYWVGHRERTVGQALKYTKNRIGGGSWYTDFYEKVWSAEYNQYGDPKYGATEFPALASLLPAHEGAAEPPSHVDVVVPAFETTTIEGIDHVTIPGGNLLLEYGRPRVPFYAREIEYPEGYKVQDVVLTEKSGLEVTSGLTLPLQLEQWDMAPSEWQAMVQEGWWPEKEYDWSVRQLPNGTSVLTIRMYAFFYDETTQASRFYGSFGFDIDHMTSTVTLDLEPALRGAYTQGMPVPLDLWIENTGAPQDVLVDAVVRATGTGEVVDGLPLQTLHGLAGDATFSTEWDSAGFQPDDYAFEVILRDLEGNVLDTAIQEFQLGIYAAEVTTFEATPQLFEVGDSIDIAFKVLNSGTVPMTGTAIIQVKDDAGQVVEEFRHNVDEVSPGGHALVDNVWETASDAGGFYRVFGYVLYESKATEPRVVLVGSHRRAYLPLIIRNH